MRATVPHMSRAGTTATMDREGPASPGAGPPQGAAPRIAPVANTQLPAPRMAGQPQPKRYPVAADGYSVVAIRNHRKWVESDRRLGLVFDEREYYFATERERQIFAAAPDDYAPALSGDCLVAYARTGWRVPGKIEYGVVSRGRIFFFASGENRDEFRRDPGRYLDADLVDGGQCPVSRIDDGRSVAGLAATTTVYHGLRYRFAGVPQRRAFLAGPAKYARAAEPASAAGAAASGSSTQIGGPVTTLVKNPAGGDGQSDQRRKLVESSAGLDGYCPVSILTRGIWVRGRYEHRVEVGSLILVTAGAEEQQIFARNPARYVPVLEGDCPVSFVDEGKRVRGDIYHAVEYEGRLYMFADRKHKEAFDADPKKYELCDVAAGGACVVTQKEKGETVPGLAKYAVWHNDKLYRFVGEEEKARFEAAPEKYEVK